ncbi:MAG: hypothetical protein QM722_02715 [Piscinibacter sp.]
MDKRPPARSGHRLDAQAFAAVLLAMFLATGGYVLDAAFADSAAAAARA